MWGIFFPPFFFLGKFFLSSSFLSLEETSEMDLGKEHFNVAALGNNHKLKMVAQVWQGTRALKSRARNAPGFTVWTGETVLILLCFSLEHFVTMKTICQSFLLFISTKQVEMQNKCLCLEACADAEAIQTSAGQMYPGSGQLFSFLGSAVCKQESNKCHLLQCLLLHGCPH